MLLLKDIKNRLWRSYTFGSYFSTLLSYTHLQFTESFLIKQNLAYFIV